MTEHVGRIERDLADVNDLVSRIQQALEAEQRHAEQHDLP